MRMIYAILTAISFLLPNTLATASDGRFSDPVPTVTRYTVENDPGGVVPEFHEAIKMMKDSGNGVRLNGYCASACTLLMNESVGLDICVTEKAELRIHKPFLVRLGFHIVRTIPAIFTAEKIWREDFYQKYPTWLQTYIDDHGGAPSVYTGSAPSDMLVVGYDVLRQHMTVCNTGTTSAS